MLAYVFLLFGTKSTLKDTIVHTIYSRDSVPSRATLPKCQWILLFFPFFWSVTSLLLQTCSLLHSTTGDFNLHYCLNLFFKRFIYLKILFTYLLFRERGREGEREGNINAWEIHRLVASCTPPCGEPGPQPRHVPWELNLWPFGSQDSAQSTESHKPGLLS